MKTEVMNKVSRSIHKVGFKLKKHSPEILIAVGVVGTVASAVMACKATLKVRDIVDETKDTVEKIHDGVEQELHTADGELYTQELANRDLAIVYSQTAWKFIKLYGPSVALGAFSVGCMVASNRILRKRNIALAAAYTAVEASFKDYRDRVVERFGKELDRELKYNIKSKEVEETVVDENGNETTVNKTIQVADPNAYSIYSVVFCEGNLGWTKDAALNKVFLIQQQNQLNDRLKARGYLTLNDVYEALGIRTTSYGQVAGWVWTEDSSIGDNYVDFGLFNLNDEKACQFLNGDERSFILDFNCIGNILPYM